MPYPPPNPKQTTNKHLSIMAKIATSTNLDKINGTGFYLSIYLSCIVYIYFCLWQFVIPIHTRPILFYLSIYLSIYLSGIVYIYFCLCPSLRLFVIHIHTWQILFSLSLSVVNLFFFISDPPFFYSHTEVSKRYWSWFGNKIINITFGSRSTKKELAIEHLEKFLLLY